MKAGWREHRRRLGLACLLTLGILAGCSEKKVVLKEEVDNLRKVAKAYREATQKLGHPPANVAELKPFLKNEGDPDGLLISPNDGQPYVILWGINPNAERGPLPGVIGYEKEGHNGHRFVFTSMGVVLMKDEDFPKANFPRGQKPAL